MLSKDEIIYIMKELAEGMAYLWQNYKIALCDLKEDNILLSLNEMADGYTIKIADFGAGYRQTETDRDKNSGYGLVCTPVYFN